MTNNGIVQIHGKDYMTVARRVELAQESKALEGVETEVLSHDPVVVRAKVTIRGTVYTGISAVDLNSSRVIEKQNPYEVAETSAVGRALGFAGYGLLESIASADEVTRAVALQTTTEKSQGPDIKEDTVTCEVCGASATERKGKTRAGKQYHGIFCSTENRSHTRWLWN
jgi:hypothetical protein